MLGSPALDSDGSLVYAHARFRDVPASSGIVVELLGVTGPIAQGLVVRTTAGKLLLGDHREEAFVFWTATMPGRVEMEMTNRKPATVVVYNTWSGREGAVVRPWAGIKIAPSEPNAWTLRCSTGVTGPDFAALTVRLTLTGGVLLP